jgi:hypothetical protein
VLDAASRRLLGWSIADHLRTELCTDALRAAVTTRGRARFDGVIFHSDHGCQGGFHRSSQHLEMEVVGDGCWQTAASDPCDARTDVVAGEAVDGAA